MSVPSFTCLIPAYNEAARIGGVLEAAVGHPLIDKVVVIDDGSSDGTGDVARAGGAELIRTPANLGKTDALVFGLRKVTTSHVILLDADLTGLSAAAVTALINPVRSGSAYASVSLRGNAPWTWRQIGIDYISGERVFPLSLVDGCLDRLVALPRFGFEVFLNRLLIEVGRPVAIVAWPAVRSPSKAIKRGRWAGAKADAAMLADIVRTIGPLGFVTQIQRLRRQALVPTDSFAVRLRRRADRLRFPQLRL